MSKGSNTALAVAIPVNTTGSNFGHIYMGYFNSNSDISISLMPDDTGTFNVTITTTYSDGTPDNTIVVPVSPTGYTQQVAPNISSVAIGLNGVVPNSGTVTSVLTTCNYWAS